MFFSSWPRNRKRHGYPRTRPTIRPTLETLEDRWVPSTLTVTNTLDSGAGSLRADVTAALKGDTIVFNIPKSDPGYNASTGVWTITLTSGPGRQGDRLSLAPALGLRAGGTGLFIHRGPTPDRR
jgi:hypothetical protein